MIKKITEDGEAEIFEEVNKVKFNEYPMYLEEIDKRFKELGKLDAEEYKKTFDPIDLEMGLLSIIDKMGSELHWCRLSVIKLKKRLTHFTKR